LDFEGASSVDPRDLSEQFAAIVLVGQETGRHACWVARDAMDLSHSFRIAKTAIKFDFYDAFFYYSDLSTSEINLYSTSADFLSVRISRPPRIRHVASVLALGWAIDEDSLHING